MPHEFYAVVACILMIPVLIIWLCIEIQSGDIAKKIEHGVMYLDAIYADEPEMKNYGIDLGRPGGDISTACRIDGLGKVMFLIQKDDLQWTEEQLAELSKPGMVVSGFNNIEKVQPDDRLSWPNSPKKYVTETERANYWRQRAKSAEGAVRQRDKQIWELTSKNYDMHDKLNLIAKALQ